MAMRVADTKKIPDMGSGGLYFGPDHTYPSASACAELAVVRQQS